jgi:hypothetical protein
LSSFRRRLYPVSCPFVRFNDFQAYVCSWVSCLRYRLVRYSLFALDFFLTAARYVPVLILHQFRRLMYTQPPPMKLSPDLLEAKHWIFPLNQPKRDYQFNIVKHCLFDNTLVALPTGLGKTFIAGVVMLNCTPVLPSLYLVFIHHGFSLLNSLSMVSGWQSCLCSSYQASRCTTN